MSTPPSGKPLKSCMIKSPVCGDKLKRHTKVYFGTFEEYPPTEDVQKTTCHSFGIKIDEDCDAEINEETDDEDEPQLNDDNTDDPNPPDTPSETSREPIASTQAPSSDNSDRVYPKTPPRKIAPTKRRRGGNRSYRIGVESAPPTMVDLPKMHLGAVELLTFFPNHTIWPELMIRLHRAGWANSDIARCALHARGTLSRGNLTKRSAALRQQILRCGREKFADASFKPSTHAHLLRPPVSTGGRERYDASGYRPLRTELRKSRIVARLVDLADGVVNWPGPSDAGPLTQAIRWAGENDADGRYLTTDIQMLASKYGFRYPFEFGTELWDLGGRNRVFASVAGV